MAQLYEEYMAVASEQSPAFLADKRAIEESFAQQLRIIDNFRKSKKEIVIHEALFLQQVAAQAQQDV